MAKPYTDAQYEESLQLFKKYTGYANDFAPVGLPSYYQMHRHQERCPAFRFNYEKVRAARQRIATTFKPPGMRPKFAAADFEKYLLAIPASTCVTVGEHKSKRTPGYPSIWTVKNFAKSNPEYAKRLEAAFASRWEAAWEPGRHGGHRIKSSEPEILRAIDAFRSFTGASPFYFKAPGLPRYQALARHAAKTPHIADKLSAAEIARQALRRELGLYDNAPRYGRGHKRPISDKDKAQYISAIVSGTSRKALEANTPFSKDIRERVSKEDPAFAAAVALANRQRLKVKYEASAARLKARERERSRRRRNVGAVYEIGQLRIQLRLNDMYVAADQALKSYRHLPDYVRDDIRSDMVEAMIDRSLSLEEADERAFEYVEAHNRNFSPHNHKSTDQTLSEDSAETIGNRLTADDYCYAE